MEMRRVTFLMDDQTDAHGDTLQEATRNANFRLLMRLAAAQFDTVFAMRDVFRGVKHNDDGTVEIIRVMSAQVMTTQDDADLAAFATRIEQATRVRVVYINDAAFDERKDDDAAAQTG